VSGSSRGNRDRIDGRSSGRWAAETLPVASEEKFANQCCMIELVHMHSGLYHSKVSSCQVDHNLCLLQYSLDLWSLDFLHIHDRAVFDLHQTPNLDSNDRKFHCDSPLEYGFEQFTVAK
jgi:hypothetical protein